MAEDRIAAARARSERSRDLEATRVSAKRANEAEATELQASISRLAAMLRENGSQGAVSFPRWIETPVHKTPLLRKPRWVGGRLGEPVVGWQVAVGEVSGSYADHPYHHPGIIVRTSGEVVSVPGGALRQLGSTGDWRGEALPPHEGPAVALDGYKAAERVLADLVVEHGLG